MQNVVIWTVLIGIACWHEDFFSRNGNRLARVLLFVALFCWLFIRTGFSKEPTSSNTVFTMVGMGAAVLLILLKLVLLVQFHFLIKARKQKGL